MTQYWFPSSKTYDAVMAEAKAIEEMAYKLANKAKAYYGSLEPMHQDGELIDDEVLQDDFEHLQYLSDSIHQEMHDMEKAVEKHRTALEDEEQKAEKCLACKFLHDPVRECEVHELDELPCLMFVKVVVPAHLKQLCKSAGVI